MQNILEAKDLKKVFYKNRVPFEAVDGVSFHIGKGECLGLAGESGCGKSTIAKIITRLIMPEEGSVRLDGKVQMVFQTPQDSFDPRRTLGDGIMEGMCNQGMGKKQAKERACEMLDLVGLTREQVKALPPGILGLTRTDSPEQLARIYSCADVLVNPTYEDNYPTVNLEARACGTPVVCYDTGGSRETLGSSDLLIPKGDRAALLRAIKQVCEETP